MKTYLINSKIATAKKSVLGNINGHYVTILNGETTFYQKEIFERVSEPLDTFTFGIAHYLMLQGNKVMRKSIPNTYLTISKQSLGIAVDDIIISDGNTVNLWNPTFDYINAKDWCLIDEDVITKQG